MIEELYKAYLNFPEIETDTREIKKNDIFFALKGPNFNGNTFALKALELGASYVVVDEDINSTDARIFKVKDVLSTLQDLALHHRKQFNIPFIAITGSNGKTTTKELVHAVLSSTLKTYTTFKNLNNHIGIPKTILKIKHEAEIAVIEMGANHQKEIESYCNYTLPTHGIITNCGKAHLEGFRGVEGVKKGKGELFDFLKTNQGSAFIYNDYDYLTEMSHGIKNIISYGNKTDAEIMGYADVETELLKVYFTKGFSLHFIQTNLVGDYNLPNILCAVAVGKHFSISDEKIKSAIENYIPDNNRSQLIQIDTNKIILDSYNANPSSMKVAIENFAKQPYENKILMLGGMMELGKESIDEHQSLINLINKHNFNEVVLVGGDFENVNHSFQFFKSSLEAKEWFLKKNFTNSAILIKGSRSTKMEQIIK